MILLYICLNKLRCGLEAFFDQLFLILVYGSIVLGLFVVLLLNNREIRKSRANVFLSVLLLAMVFSIFHIRYAGNVLNHFSVRAYNLGDPTFFLIAPLLWFYTQELTGRKVKFSLASALHFTPFLILVACSLSFKLISPGSRFIMFLDTYPRMISIVFWSTVVLQFSGYQWLRQWAVYQQMIKEEVSNTEGVNISWIKFFMAVFLAINLAFLFSLIAVIHFVHMAWLAKSIAIVLSLSVFALGYRGILQREVFYHRQNEESPALPLKSEPKADHELLQRLYQYMEERKPFLNPELTLSGLAKELDISRSQLSQLINDGAGDNFYNFINKYRVDQVKKFMIDPAMKNFNMLGIALEAGFKSKSTFNLIFKRFTGLTPTEYRKNLSA